MSNAAKVADIHKQMQELFGPNTVRLGNDPYFNVDVFSTGILPMDVLLGGGVPRGRYTEIYGPYSSLKTYIGYCTIAVLQKNGGVAGMVDTEHTFDETWARSIGVNTDELLLVQPETGEKGIDRIEALTRAKLDLIVWDSIAATLPKDEQEKAMDDKMQPARLAFLMSAGLRKLTAANMNSTAILCMNQIREKVGISFGNPEVTPGGRAMPFYASHRIGMRRTGLVKAKVKYHNGDAKEEITEYYGQRIRAYLEKSKVTAPHREVSFVYDFKTQRIDSERYALGAGLEIGVIENKGNSWWLAADPNNKTIGRENMIERLRANPPEMALVSRALLSGSRGADARPKRKEGGRKPASSAAVAPDPTPTAAPDGSRTTAARRKRTTKSSRPAVASR